MITSGLLARCGRDRFIDAIVGKVDDGQVRDKPIYAVIGVFGLMHGSVFAGMAVARWLRA
jgi:hypothetical protein